MWKGRYYLFNVSRRHFRVRCTRITLKLSLSQCRTRVTKYIFKSNNAPKWSRRTTDTKSPKNKETVFSRRIPFRVIVHILLKWKFGCLLVSLNTTKTAKQIWMKFGKVDRSNTRLTLRFSYFLWVPNQKYPSSTCRPSPCHSSVGAEEWQSFSVGGTSRAAGAVRHDAQLAQEWGPCPVWTEGTVALLEVSCSLPYYHYQRISRMASTAGHRPTPRISIRTALA